MSLETTRELLEQLKMKHTIEINFLEIAIKEELTGLVHGTSISWRSQSSKRKSTRNPTATRTVPLSCNFGESRFQLLKFSVKAARGFPEAK